MPQLTHHETSAFSTQQLFELVADVPAYPQFLPWCKGARILKQESENVFLAELVIGFKGITERYTSRVTLTPYDSIRAEMVDGPFHHLVNDWRFISNDEQTVIELDLDFQFKSKLLEGMIGGLFERASEKMISAFRERAKELYTRPLA